MSIPSNFPQTPLFSIKQTASSGRGVFANQNIPSGTHLLTTRSADIVLIRREYRREVCAHCFAYDLGIEWKLRDKDIGFVFCSKKCQTQWYDDAGVEGVEAWHALHKLVKGTPREEQMVDADTTPATVDGIDAAWRAAGITARTIRAVRTSGTPTKHQRKILQEALAFMPSPDTLSFLLSGILCHHQRPTEWAEVLELATNPQCYTSTEDLAEHVSSFLHLLARMPMELLKSCTPDVCYTIANRDSHNAFSLRSSSCSTTERGDDGSEFLGYGTWPQASYWNHSCEPNVMKVRRGREWVFSTAREVEEGRSCVLRILGARSGSWWCGRGGGS